MNWYIVIFALAGLIVIYKVATAKPRKVSALIADTLGVKKYLVDNMLADMGKERGKSFVNYIFSWGNKENHGIYTFIVYQVMKNDSSQNIKCWKYKLAESNIQPNMNFQQAEVAFMFLRDAGADINRVSKFLDVYNNIS